MAKDQDRSAPPSTVGAGFPSEPSGAHRNRLLGGLKLAAQSAGCLVIVVLSWILAAAALAMFLDDPAIWLVFIGLLVALSARQAATGRSRKS